MIPYFEYHTIQLGPIPIQVWGLFVALGILIGTKVSAERAKRQGLKPKLIWDMASWVIIAAFVGARLFHVVLYEPQFFLANPSEILAVWHGGFSIIGGLLAAGVTAILYMRKHHVDVWKYSDAAVFGLPLGMAIGRIGCFLIHDHPGTATDFVLGVEYPDEVVRHDLGLYQAISAAILFVIFLGMSKKKLKAGWYLAVFLLYYGASRIFLDTLRATDGAIVDTRYGQFTPTQYVGIALIGGGIWLIYKKLSARN